LRCLASAGYISAVKTAARVALAGVLLWLLAVPPALAQLTEADVYVGQAIVDFDEKQYQSALENLDRALQIEPDHVEALYYAGVVRMALRRPGEAIPFLERARAKAPTDPAITFQLGLAHFAQQQYERAQPLLEEVFRAQPGLEGLGYYVGFLRYRGKDYRGALRAFEAGRTVDPELQQLTRLYSGLSLAALGLPGQAAAQVEQALRLAPGSAVTGPAERLRDMVVAARREERRFFAEVRAGVFYDDNVRVLPDAVDLDDTDTDLLVDIIRRDSEQAKESFGELFGVRLDYNWLKTPDWESTVGYSFFMTYYNEVTSFNITDHLVSADLVYKTAIRQMPLNIGLQYLFDALFLDDDEFVRRSTVALFGTLTESQHHLSQVIARYQHKEFNETTFTITDESRDAHNWMMGFLHFFRFAEDRHFIKMGYQFDREDAGRNFTYHGHRILFGVMYTLPWRSVRLRYDLDVHIRDYQYTHSLLPSFDPDTKRRHDTEVNHTVRVEVPLPYSFTVTAEYLNVDNHSNLQVFDYGRSVTSLILTWSY
jgi:tetratricopeptide (TPR) repeat protein